MVMSTFSLYLISFVVSLVFGTLILMLVAKIFKQKKVFTPSLIVVLIVSVVVFLINLIPLGTKTPSVSKYVTVALKVLKKEKDLKYELTAMGTIVEAESLDLLLNLAKKMHQAVLSENISRVVTTIKIDDRKDKKSSIEEKIRRVHL